MRLFRSLTIFTIILVTSLNVFAGQGRVLNNRLLIELSPGYSAKLFETSLPKSFRIIAKQPFGSSEFLIVEAKAKISDAFLVGLRKNTKIRFVERDHLVPYQNDEKDSANVPCVRSQVSNREAADLKKDVDKIAFPLTCEQKSACPGGLYRSDWAIKAVNADLAVAELKKYSSVQTRPVKVAVLDSGYGLDGTRVKKFKGWDEAGDPNIDEFGHGSATTDLVTSVLQGMDNKNAEISFYRIANPGSSPNVKDSGVSLSLLKACSDGNRIINLSATWDAPWQIKEKLEKAGCLVIESAGNNHALEAYPSAGLLSVGATLPSGAYASDFSGHGEMTAPGVRVPARMPKSATMSLYAESQGDRCGDDTYFLTGTSFSAPLVAGVAVLVQSALETSTAYLSLERENPPLAVNILHKVLLSGTEIPRDRFSHHGNALNALKAVKIAEFCADAQLKPCLNKDGKAELPSDNEVQKILTEREKAACNAPVPVCSSVKSGDCSAFSSCLNQLRARSSICEPSNTEVELALFSSFVTSGQYELGLRQFLSFPELQHSPAVSQAAGELLLHESKTWPKNRDQFNAENNAYFELSLLNSWLSEKNFSGDSTDVSKAVVRFFAKNPFPVYWKPLDQPNFGDNNDKAMIQILRGAVQRLSDHELKSTLQNITNSIDPTENLAGVRFGSLVGMLTVVGQEVSTAKRNAIRADVKALCDRLMHADQYSSCSSCADNVKKAQSLFDFK